MSKNLLKVGFELTVWNRTESKMEEIVKQSLSLLFVAR